MNEITPLAVGFWLWMGLFVYWLMAALSVQKTRRSESAMGRLQHLVPLFVAFYLLFSRHRWSVVYGRLYETGWRDWAAVAGLALTVAGLAFTVYARIHLGRYWSGVITLKEGHRLITTGPYRVVRHPIYTGWLLGMLGTAMMTGTGDAFAGVALVAAAFVVKLRREERLLSGEFGEEYAQFKRDVPAAMVPLVF